MPKGTKPIRQTRFMCPHKGCREWAFPSQIFLDQHEKRVHSGRRAFKCPHCDHSASQKVNLGVHLRVQHIGGRYQCPHCPMRMADGANISRHAKNKHNDLSFSTAGLVATIHPSDPLPPQPVEPLSDPDFTDVDAFLNNADSFFANTGVSGSEFPIFDYPAAAKPLPVTQAVAGAGFSGSLYASHLVHQHTTTIIDPALSLTNTLNGPWLLDIADSNYLELDYETLFGSGSSSTCGGSSVTSDASSSSSSISWAGFDDTLLSEQALAMPLPCNLATTTTTAGCCVDCVLYPIDGQRCINHIGFFC